MKASKVLAFLAGPDEGDKFKKSEKINNRYLREGFTYYENCTVLKDGIESEYLFQLLNPHFNNKIKIYNDSNSEITWSDTPPRGRRSIIKSRFKSYYLKLQDDKFVYKIEKKSYKNEFQNIWKQCQSVLIK